MSLALIACALLTGTLIGALGVGGVLLAPLLVLLSDLTLHEAIAAASLSFFFTGLVGTVCYSRHGTIAWPLARRLVLGALPAALVGAFVSTRLGSTWVGLPLALLTLTAGLNSLRQPGAASRTLSPRHTLFLGIGVGFGSALTGTGGPVLLLPLLTLLRVAPRGAVGASQVIQLPLALLAGLGFWLFGTLHLGLALGLGVVQGVGAAAGASLAHALPVRTLQKALAVILLATGSALLVKSLLAL
jgi:uncharacterized membrane protein YfcA